MNNHIPLTTTTTTTDTTPTITTTNTINGDLKDTNTNANYWFERYTEVNLAYEEFQEECHSIETELEQARDHAEQQLHQLQYQYEQQLQQWNTQKNRYERELNAKIEECKTIEKEMLKWKKRAVDAETANDELERHLRVTNSQLEEITEKNVKLTEELIMMKTEIEEMQSKATLNR
jgi:chromosome segregation ATPase